MFALLLSAVFASSISEKHKRIEHVLGMLANQPQDEESRYARMVMDGIEKYARSIDDDEGLFDTAVLGEEGDHNVRNQRNPCEKWNSHPSCKRPPGDYSLEWFPTEYQCWVNCSNNMDKNEVNEKMDGLCNNFTKTICCAIYCDLV